MPISSRETFFWAGKTSPIPCQHCGGPVIEFSIPSPLWNSIMRPDGREHTKEYICIDCFLQFAANSISKPHAD